MGYGLEVKGDSYNVQIDGETIVFGLVTRGSFEGTQNITVDNLSSPVMALSGGGLVTNVTNNGNTYTWTIASAADRVEYFIFDTTNGVPPAGGVGMEVFGPTGQLVYSSSVRPMNIIQFVTASPDTINFPSFPGRRLAIMQVTQPATKISTYFTGGAFGQDTYDANVTEEILTIATPRSDQSITGNLNSIVASVANQFNGEAGRGPPPSPTVEYYGSWGFWVFDVTNLV